MTIGATMLITYLTDKKAQIDLGYRKFYSIKLVRLLNGGLWSIIINSNFMYFFFLFKVKNKGTWWNFKNKFMLFSIIIELVSNSLWKSISSLNSPSLHRDKERTPCCFLPTEPVTGRKKTSYNVPDRWTRWRGLAFH